MYLCDDLIRQVDATEISGPCAIGALVGAITGLLLGVPFVVASFSGMGWVLLATTGTIVLVTAGYLAAKYTAPDTSELFRGFLIGMNAGLTFALATAVGRVFLVSGWALAIGSVLGAIVLVAAVRTVSQSAIYQGILGWSSALMPPTWVVNALGLAFFTLSLLGALVTLGRAPALAITGIAIHRQTGTIFLRGGWIANLNREQTAFDMGHFGFVHKDSPSYYLEHETGHTLSLGAFGSVFHLVGFIDEMSPAGSAAYSEQLAEGHDPAGTGPMLPMWSCGEPDIAARGRA